MLLMERRPAAHVAFVAFVVAAVTALTATTHSVGTAASGGTIVGHVRVNGTPPGNPVLRMGMDPACAAFAAGKRVPDQIVVVTPDGSLANVFAKLEGSFPAVPVPSQPVVVDQRACMYTPRVVGARVGQVLEIRNSDPVLHNVNSSTLHGNSFIWPAARRRDEQFQTQGRRDDAARDVRRAPVDERLRRRRSAPVFCGQQSVWTVHDRTRPARHVPPAVLARAIGFDHADGEGGGRRHHTGRCRVYAERSGSEVTVNESMTQ
jgi:hypothetical protein